MSFNIAMYEQIDIKKVDTVETKRKLGVFLSAYLSARTRVGQPREPKITSSFSLVPPSFSNQNSAQAEEILIQNEEAREELLYLHNLFSKGYSAIQHPFKPEIADRRKKIFYDRYVSGHSIYITAERYHISEDLVSQETSKALVQFCETLGILVLKEKKT